VPFEPVEVDLTLIDELRAMTPEERIDLNDRTLAMIEELRRGVAIAEAHPAHPGRAPR
jgi:hypothetical protein